MDSSISTFLTNLRLLDFDLAEDWPTITSGLFLPKDIRANQKQRVRCVEWALYKLFELWNLKETKNKLRPFFPPYDALRSANLRAALFRCLNEMKKEGILGKDVMIRKSMFDDCRGEKFEELLASFSTIVFQKVTRTRSGATKNLASRIAARREIPTSEQKSMLPLAIAHQGALRALLQKKEELRQRYARLHDILKEKEQQLLRRVDDLAQEDQDEKLVAVPDRTIQPIREQFDRNWQGNAGWINLITEADRRDCSDPLLDSAFLTVWSATENGTIGDVGKTGEKSLLQDLNRSIHDQQSRLLHWQKIHQDLISSRPKSPVKTKDTPYRSRGVQSPLKFRQLEPHGLDGSFNDAAIALDLKSQHRRLLVGVNKSAVSEEQKTPTKVADSNASDGEDSDASGSASQTSSAVPGREASNMDYSEPAPESALYPENRHHMYPPATTPAQTSIVHNSTPLNRAQGKLVGDGGTTTITCDRSTDGTSGPPKHTTGRGHNPSKSPGGPLSPSCDVAPGHEEDELAHRPPFSSEETQRSPMKRTTSLLERTRQSIAFAGPESFLPDTPDAPILVQPSEKVVQNDELPHRSSSLLERTRRSISLVPASSSTSKRRSMHHRRQSKQYPTNQFETPKKHLEDVKEMTPPEVLFSPEADYASVFRSRPKIATSNTFSSDLVLLQREIRENG
ncbi:MAG: hypothetical protein Q9219_002519 [cf. Caloplaca sp. 3 TL-2023]